MDTFNEIIREKNINLAKLAEITGVSERFLSALVKEEFEKLPPSPYVRSYLFKLAEVLGLDGQKLWQEYQKNAQLKKSGVSDRLPLNRYQPRTLNKKLFFLLVVIVLVCGFLFFRFHYFLTKPQLLLFGQLADAPSVTVSVPIIKVEGQIQSGDRLFLNQEKILAEANGRFQKDIVLQPGLNILQFQINRFLGRETITTKQVIYLP